MTVQIEGVAVSLTPAEELAALQTDRDDFLNEIEVLRAKQQQDALLLRALQSALVILTDACRGKDDTIHALQNKLTSLTRTLVKA